MVRVKWLQKSVFVLCSIFLTTSFVYADQVIPDDLIVYGSICVGAGCVDGEVFGFSTLTLKEDDVRINFQDTSNSGAFPSQDWSIIANDSAAGGNDYFAISDGNDPVGADFILDPSSNTFHIMADKIEVGNVDALRLLSNVADGVDLSDAATVGQLQPIQDSLDALLDAGTNQAVIINDLQSRMVDVETDITTIDERVGAVETAIQANADTMAENRSDIDALDQQVQTNSEDIADLQALSEGFAATGDGGSVAPSATGTGSTAVGMGASSRTRDTAVGFEATVTADGSVAVGANSLVESINSVAVGADAHVEINADGGIALGQNAQVAQGANGSVAIGQNSIAREANTVSVGSAGNERRVTNVADAVNSTDAVTLGQLQQVEMGLQSDLTRLDNQINNLEDRLDKVGAMASAFSALVPNPYDSSRTQIALGLGHYSGANSMAAGLFHAPSDRILINSGVSTSFDRNTTAGRAGITIGW